MLSHLTSGAYQSDKEYYLCSACVYQSNGSVECPYCNHYPSITPQSWSITAIGHFMDVFTDEMRERVRRGNARRPRNRRSRIDSNRAERDLPDQRSIEASQASEEASSGEGTGTSALAEEESDHSKRRKGGKRKADDRIQECPQTESSVDESISESSSSQTSTHISSRVARKKKRLTSDSESDAEGQEEFYNQGMGSALQQQRREQMMRNQDILEKLGFS